MKIEMLTRTLVYLILVFTFLKGSKNPGILTECGNNWQKIIIYHIRL